MLSQTKTRDKVCDLLKDDGTLTNSGREKAEVLNDFFVSVFTRENLTYIPTLPTRNFEKELEMFVITSADVLKKLSALKASKSAGPDGLHCKILLELKESLCESLTRIFNKSLESGEVTTQWRRAHVSPIFKKGDKKQSENWRPVSLTCVVCKSMESLVRDKLISHMENNKLFSAHQFGLRSGCSCAMQLLCVLEDWSRALDCNEYVDVVYLEFRKAFDTVPHARLIDKLYAYGIRGNLLTWIQNSLTNRKQKVIVQGEESQ